MARRQFWPDFRDAEERTKRLKIGGRPRPFTQAVIETLTKFDEATNGFFYSDPNIDDDAAENERWNFSRPLGAGSVSTLSRSNIVDDGFCCSNPFWHR